MKTKLFVFLQILSFLAIPLVVMPLVAAAQTAPPTTPVGFSDLQTWLLNARNWIFSIIMLLAAIVLLIGAFNILTAGGDSAKVTTGKNWIIYGIIGVILALMSQGLLSLACSFFGYIC